MISNCFHWEEASKYREGIQITCQALNDLHFQESGISISDGNVFKAIYLGVEKEDERQLIILKVAQYPSCCFGLSLQEIAVLEMKSKVCLVCENHYAVDVFKRHTRIRDKSPILLEVCEQCFRSIKKRVDSYNSEARRNDSEFGFKVSDWLEILQKSQGKCHYCQKSIGLSKLIMEHVRPLSWKGNNTKENIVAACNRCNMSKGDRDYETWQRHIEGHQLLQALEKHLGLSKFETINLAVKHLAVHEGLLKKQGEVAEE